MLSSARVTDELLLELHRKAIHDDGIELGGVATLALFDRRGRLAHSETVHNLITDAGDLYYAGKAVTGIGPAAPSAPTPVNGMKLGTGTTAAAKAGAGGALVTYKTGSNLAFDAGFAATTNLGAGLGVTANYKTTWGAGVATDTALTEAVIVNDQASNATSSLTNTISRIVFTAVNKGASDTLAITWTHKFLGA